MNEQCPICGEGELHPTTDTITVWKLPNGKETVDVLICFSVCDNCESEITNNPQSERNAKRVTEARDG